MTLDDETRAFLHQLNATSNTESMRSGLAAMGIDAAREMSRALFMGTSEPCVPACKSEELRLDGRNGPICARLYRPMDMCATDHRGTPLVLFFHGGGWAMGDLDSYHELVGDLCARSGVALLSVAYRLAPEHGFPEGLHDCIDSLIWAARHAAELGIDGRRIAVMGDSAGGNLAAAAAHNLHRGREVRLAAQYLVYPVLDISRPHTAYPSRMEWGGGGYLLDREAIDTTADWYLGGSTARRDDPDVSPMCIEDLSILPPTVLIAAGHDPLRSENEIFASRLGQAGVETCYRCYDGTIHAFLSFPQLGTARDARAWLARDMKSRLGPTKA